MNDGSQASPAAPSGGSSPPEALVHRLDVRQAAVFALVSAGAMVLLALARSKVTAVFLGPDGIGRSAFVNQIVSLMSVPLSALSGTALVVAMGRAAGAGDRESAQRVYDSAFFALLGGATVAGLLAVAASTWMLPASMRAWQDGPLLVAIASGALVMSILTTVPSQALIACGQVRESTRLSIAQAVVGFLLSVSLVAAFKLVGLFVAALVLPLVVVLPTMVLTKRALPFLRVVPKPRVDLAFLKTAAALGAAGFVSGWAQQLMLTTIRLSLDRVGGTSLTGQFQAAIAIEASLFTVLSTTMTTAIFPRFAAAATTRALCDEVHEAHAFVRRYVPPIALLGLAVRGPIIVLLYDHRFDQAARVLAFLLVADLIRCASWIGAGVLLTRGHWRVYGALEVTAALAIGAASVACIPRYGLEGAGIAYVVGSALHLWAGSWLAHRVAGAWFEWRAALLISMVAGAFVAVVFALSWYRPLSFVAAGTAVVWMWRTGLLSAIGARVRNKLGRLRGRTAP